MFCRLRLNETPLRLVPLPRKDFESLTVAFDHGEGPLLGGIKTCNHFIMHKPIKFDPGQCAERLELFAPEPRRLFDGRSQRVIELPFVSSKSC